MPRRRYNETGPPTGNSVITDRIQPMRGYFASLPGGPYIVNDCDNLQDVKNKYPELFTDDTHRDAVRNIWVAGGHMLDYDSEQTY